MENPGRSKVVSIDLKFREFEGSRIRLRKLKVSDADDLFLIRSDDRVNRFINRKKATSTDEVRDWILKRNEDIDNNMVLYWALALIENDKLIGTICFFNLDRENKSGEIGYELMPEYQGNGYVSESLKFVIKHVFADTGIARIDAVIAEGNESSLKLIRRFNFKKNAKKEIREDSRTLHIYSLYQSSPSEKPSPEKLVIFHKKFL